MAPFHRATSTGTRAFPLVGGDNPPSVVNVRFWRGATEATQLAGDIAALLDDPAIHAAVTHYALAATGPNMFVSVVITSGYLENSHAIDREEQWMADRGITPQPLDSASRGPVLVFRAMSSTVAPLPTPIPTPTPTAP